MWPTERWSKNGPRRPVRDWKSFYNGPLGEMLRDGSILACTHTVFGFGDRLKNRLGDRKEWWGTLKLWVTSSRYVWKRPRLKEIRWREQSRTLEVFLWPLCMHVFGQHPKTHIHLHLHTPFTHTWTHVNTHSHNTTHTVTSVSSHQYHSFLHPALEEFLSLIKNIDCILKQIDQWFFYFPSGRLHVFKDVCNLLKPIY